MTGCPGQTLQAALSSNRRHLRPGGARRVHWHCCQLASDGRKEPFMHYVVLQVILKEKLWGTARAT